MHPVAGGEQLLEWQTALDTFVASWRSRPEVTGALACGSYVTGSPSPRSDIDVHILLKEGTAWRQRGNQIVGGYMIEYFVNPPSQMREEFRGDHRSNSWIAMVPFATGRIIFDEAGDLKRLKAEAEQWMAKPFELIRDPHTVENMKYGLWDTWDNARDAYEANSPDFPMVHYNSLTAVFRIYSRHLGWHLPSTHQIYGLLTSPLYRARYLIPPFPDSQFVTLFQKAADAPDRNQMMAAMDAMAMHAMEAIGGFQVDGWSSRSEIK